ncbi:PREDICTED: UPF0488 protein C8orf33 homolog, partial [Acanthisitta chloris]|uniref:UPF0488 protein C8orf33 homolog n=1 Tax=Acanthisitta chloris TaxID=57068 RepID=UPI0004F0CCFC
MERAPQGVAQEELQWCISQLEADLHLSPPPKPAEETQHILKLLCSPETPLAKKQQVMSDVLGDYRLRMAEGQKSMKKAGVKPGAVEVQQSNGQADGGVKQSDPIPEAKSELFTSSGSSFQFDFTLAETDPGADPGDSGAEQQSDDQLQREVNWCVEQLELGLKTQKPTPKQAEEALRAIRTLRSDKAPLVKKRQLMRAMFGDYRKKMQEELSRELKLMETAAKSARIVEVKGSIRRKNGQFIR